MGIEKLLARLQAESVTPVTPQKSGGVTGKQASIQAVTPVTPVTPKKDSDHKTIFLLNKRHQLLVVFSWLWWVGCSRC
jgi:hypothetical protein